jgi:hypothetical protein
VIIYTKKLKMVKLKYFLIIFTITDVEKCTPITVHRNYKLLPWNFISNLNCLKPCGNHMYHLVQHLTTPHFSHTVHLYASHES